MPSRRRVAVLLALVTTVALTGCAGGDSTPDTAGTPTPTAAPTAAGERPLVAIDGTGGGEVRALTLDLDPTATSAATLVVSQQITRDDTPVVVPPITLPVELAVTGTEGEGATTRTTTTQTYGRPTLDASGLRPVDVRSVRTALAPVAGTTSTLVVRPDGTVVEATSGADATRPFDAQLRALVPVLPATGVGVGGRWVATSVEEVDGATVDQVATYSLESLEGDDYVISATIEQTYRPGPVDGVEVRSGLGTTTVRLEGSLTRLLPDSATGNVSTQVSYLVGDRVTEVRTTVSLGLTTA